MGFKRLIESFIVSVLSYALLLRYKDTRMYVYVLSPVFQLLLRNRESSMSITEIQSSSFLQANSIVLLILEKLLYIRKEEKEKKREGEREKENYRRIERKMS